MTQDEQYADMNAKIGALRDGIAAILAAVKGGKEVCFHLPATGEAWESDLRNVLVRDGKGGYVL